MHHSKELAGISGERFDVSAVPFRINRIKSECGFSRTRNPGDDDEFVTREFYIDILKVVLSCTLHDQVFHAGYMFAAWGYYVLEPGSLPLVMGFMTTGWARPRDATSMSSS